MILYWDYSRQGVHDAFSPDTRFTRGSGSWGLQGIVKIPNKPGDFVFFVTFGQHQADHTFDEWITEDGVISWQSQPRQSFDDQLIQQFIHHDEKKNSIHLFLRTQRSLDYTYLGRLKYLAHDLTREKPVNIYWQLMDWPIPGSVLRRMNLQLQPTNIFHRVIESVAESDKDNTAIIWRDRTWQIDRQTLISQVRDWITRGLPKEATRYKDWYIDIDEQRISPKWLFHLITGAGYNEFDASLARAKLSKLGLIAVQVWGTEESDSVDQEEGGHANINRMKPAERRVLFEKISYELSKEFSDTFRLARFRFPDHGNWFEIHLPNLKGYYSLRLARQFDEFAYFFPENMQADELLTQHLAPHLKTLSEQMEYPVTVEPSYWQSWNRFGFEMPHSLVVDRDGQDSMEIAYARKLGRFVQATYNQLVALMTRRVSVQSVEKSRPIQGSQLQMQILSARLDSIRQVLNGSVAIPSDDVLCEWVHFCYDFELYREGQLLFELVSSEQLNPWYYERTKKLARLCSLRTAEKD